MCGICVSSHKSILSIVNVGKSCMSTSIVLYGKSCGSTVPHISKNSVIFSNSYFPLTLMFHVYMYLFFYFLVLFSLLLVMLPAVLS